MHYFDLFTPVEYKTAIKLNRFLIDNNIGEVRLVTPFRFHGKLYSFHKKDQTIAGIIGSNNLSSIVDCRNGIYESSLLLNEPTTLCQLDRFICELKDKATDRISELEISEFKTTNILLEGQDFVQKATPEEIATCIAAKTDTIFDIPVKDTPQSNLNVFFGKGRETRSTGVIKPRHWYEAEIIVSKTITSQNGYPQAQTDTATFNVITDDGWKFKCKVSGDYSKNFRSEGDLRILGKWLKGRLENAGALSVGEQVTQAVLNEYGRSAFSLTKTTILTDDEYPENGLLRAVLIHLMTSAQVFLNGGTVCNFLVHPSILCQVHVVQNNGFSVLNIAFIVLNLAKIIFFV